MPKIKTGWLFVFGCEFLRESLLFVKKNRTSKIEAFVGGSNHGSNLGRHIGISLQCHRTSRLADYKGNALPTEPY